MIEPRAMQKLPFGERCLLCGHFRSAALEK